MNLKKIMVVPCSPHSDVSLEEVDDSIIAHNIRTFPFMLVKLAFYARNNYRLTPEKCSNYARFSK